MGLEPVKRKWSQIGGLMVLAPICIASFQNFSVPIENLKPEFSITQSAESAAQKVAERLRAGDDSYDIRTLAPPRPSDMDAPVLAIPDSGTDLGSVSRNWVSKESALLTGGADKRLLEDMNQRLNRWVKFEPVKSEPWPEAGDDAGRSPSGEPSDENDGGDDAGGNAQPLPKNIQDLFSFMPTSLRFTQANRFELGFVHQTQMSCTVDGGGLQVDLSHKLSEQLDIGIQHRGSEQANMLRLHYNW